MSGAAMDICFVTWDGPTTSYHETLFLPLLAGALRDGDRLHLLQLAWGAPERSRRIAAAAGGMGATYRLRPVGRRLRGLAAAPAVLAGCADIARFCRTSSAPTVVARSILPALMALVARTLLRAPFRFVLDADGLPADERADFGGWSRHGLRYRLFRAVERRAVRRADVVLVRTDAAAGILARRCGVDRGRFHRVVNGRDSALFRLREANERAEVRAALGIPADVPLMVYAGSLGPQYLPRQMVALFRAARALLPGTRLLVLAPAEQHGVLLGALGDDTTGATLRHAEPSEVPDLLGAADVGLALRMPALSQAAVAPIKVAEYLLSGLPVVHTRGVGDLDATLRPDVAFAVGHDGDVAEAARWFAEEVLPARDDIARRCRELGLAHLSLRAGIRSYQRALDGVRPAGV